MDKLSYSMLKAQSWHRARPRVLRRHVHPFALLRQESD